MLPHAAQPRVDTLVDLFADALDEALGHSGVVLGTEFGMRRHGSGDLLTLVGVHGLTVCRAGQPEQGNRESKHASFGITVMSSTYGG